MCQPELTYLSELGVLRAAGSPRAWAGWPAYGSEKPQQAPALPTLTSGALRKLAACASAQHTFKGQPDSRSCPLPIYSPGLLLVPQISLQCGPAHAKIDNPVPHKQRGRRETPFLFLLRSQRRLRVTFDLANKP